MKYRKDDSRVLDTFIRQQMQDVVFGYVPVDKVRYYRSEEIPADILPNFPSAYMELMEAGTCYAMDRNTAAVFHAMRALEYGLRALAKTKR